MSALIICPSCEREAFEADRFCPHCGAPQNTSGANVKSGSSSFRLSKPGGREQFLARVAEATSGRYEILEMLGMGGMAAVYLARDLRLGRKVAIKVMLPHLGLTEGMTDKFLEEARRTAQLSHPNIVVVHDVEEADELLLFVMSLVNGASLDKVIPCIPPTSPVPPRRIPFAVTQAVLVQICAGLEYAHEQGIVHRDIKPSNVMITARGEAVIADFGIAKVIDGLPTTHMGTPIYMSPEQCSEKPLTGASDQYSLGIVAYEMVAGRAPFTGGKLEIQKGHVELVPPSLRSLRADVPQTLEAAIMRMIAKRPAHRFESIEEAGRALARGMDTVDYSPRAVLGEAAKKAQSGGRDRAKERSDTPVVSDISVTTEPTPKTISLDLPLRAVVGETFNVLAVARDEHGNPLYEESVHVGSLTPDTLAVREMNSGSGTNAQRNGWTGTAIAPGIGRILANVRGVRREAVLEVVERQRLSDDKPKRTTPSWMKFRPAAVGVAVGVVLAVLAAALLNAFTSTPTVDPRTRLSDAAMSAIGGAGYALPAKAASPSLANVRVAARTEFRDNRLFIIGRERAIIDDKWDAKASDFVVHFDLQYESGEGEHGGGLQLDSDAGKQRLLIRGSQRPGMEIISDNAGPSSTLLPQIAVPSFHPGSNRVDVLLIGPTATVFINGEQVGSTSNLPVSRTGHFGLFVSPEGRYSFANLTYVALRRL